MNNQSQAVGSKAFTRGKQERVLARRRQTAMQAQLAQTVGTLAAEVEALQQRLTQMEQSGASAAPHSLAELGPCRLPPPGQTAMQAIRGKLETDEPLEDLLAQLKALE